MKGLGIIAIVLGHGIKKIKSLYAPFVVFELIFISIRNVLINLNIYDIDNINRITNMNDFIYNFKSIITLNAILDTLLGDTWFLKSLFYVSIWYPIFNIVLKNKMNI